MTQRCCLSWCKNTPSENVFLLSFPKSEDKLASWCRILDIDIAEVRNNKSAKVCSWHFKPENSTQSLTSPPPSLSITQNSNENNRRVTRSSSSISKPKTNTEETTLYERPQIEINDNESLLVEPDPLNITEEDTQYGNFDENDTSLNMEGDNDNSDGDGDGGDDNGADYVAEDVDDDDDEEYNGCEKHKRTSKAPETKRRKVNSNSNLNDKCAKMILCTCTAGKKLKEQKLKYNQLLREKKKILIGLKNKVQEVTEEYNQKRSMLIEFKKVGNDNSHIIGLLDKCDQNDDDDDDEIKDMKLALQIFKNIIRNDNGKNENQSLDKNYTKEIQTLATNLLNSSNEAYDLVYRTFKNAFPRPETITEYQQNNVFGQIGLKETDDEDVEYIQI